MEPSRGGAGDGSGPQDRAEQGGENCQDDSSGQHRAEGVGAAGEEEATGEGRFRGEGWIQGPEGSRGAGYPNPHVLVGITALDNS